MSNYEGLFFEPLSTVLAGLSILLVGIFLLINFWILSDSGENIAFTLSGNEHRAHQRFVNDTRHRTPTDRDRRRRGQLVAPLSYLYCLAIFVFIWEGVTGILSWMPPPPGDGGPLEQAIAGVAILIALPLSLHVRESLMRPATEHFQKHLVNETKRQFERIKNYLTPEAIERLVTITESAKENLAVGDGIVRLGKHLEKHRLESEARVLVLNMLLEGIDPNWKYGNRPKGSPDGPITENDSCP